MPAKAISISRLDQLRLLADPLRLRLLEEFAKGERTTKQVADTLGEKPTRLYHHVDALEKGELIRLVKTRQNRGTIEKYYEAVARRFTVGPRIFRPDEPSPSPEGMAMACSVVETTLHEVIEAFEHPERMSKSSPPLVARASIEGTGREVGEVKREIFGLIRRLQEMGEKRAAAMKRKGGGGGACGGGKAGKVDTEPHESYVLTIVFHPALRADGTD